MLLILVTINLVLGAIAILLFFIEVAPALLKHGIKPAPIDSLAAYKSMYLYLRSSGARKKTMAILVALSFVATHVGVVSTMLYGLKLRGVL